MRPATTGCPPTARAAPEKRYAAWIIPLQPRTAVGASRVERSNVAHGHDFVAARAARCGHIHDIAFGFSDDRACDRRGQRHESLLDVGLIVADELVHDLAS